MYDILPSCLIQDAPHSPCRSVQIPYSYSEVFVFRVVHVLPPPPPPLVVYHLSLKVVGGPTATLNSSTRGTLEQTLDDVARLTLHSCFDEAHFINLIAYSDFCTKIP